ncbi:MAG TPA: D-2-hydroxyacid dehydrogenase [Anaerolineales bacterium]|nr:D-2-hydroxyacid dehydrogenase [Anaerolineales bacterium]
MPETIEVLITLPFPEDLLAQLRGVSPRLNITVQKARVPEDVPGNVWKRTEVLYTNRVLPTPDQVPKLRWIQFHWAGVDHAVDDPLLQKRDLVATTLSGAAAPQMAEYVLMMLLALGHHLPDMIDHQNRTEWPKDRWERFGPQELSESTVGIVGYGSIGRQIARLLRGFGATILATKRDVMHPEDEGYVPKGLGDLAGEFVRRLYPPQALVSMIKECDFVVITVPLTEETKNLIGEREIGALKPSAYLVDVSRGGILDQEALIIALRERRIGGAALDVFPEEPLPSESPLWNFPNVIISPHISGNTPFYDERAVELFSENLHRYLAGMPLFNRIDPGRGY